MEDDMDDLSFVHECIEVGLMREPETFACTCGHTVTVWIDKHEVVRANCPKCGKPYEVALDFKKAS